MLQEWVISQKGVWGKGRAMLKKRGHGYLGTTRGAYIGPIRKGLSGAVYFKGQKERGEGVTPFLKRGLKPGLT